MRWESYRLREIERSKEYYHAKMRKYSAEALRLGEWAEKSNDRDRITLLGLAALYRSMVTDAFDAYREEKSLREAVC